MSDDKPNIVFFFWDNFGWGELGCYGGGELRGAPTPRIDRLAGEGLRLLNFNVEAQCTPSRSALLTGRHSIRSGTQVVPITGGPEGMTRWEVTIAQALSDAGYNTGMWGKWHLGSDPEQRSPVDFGFDEAVWSPRTADEVLWSMQSYFPEGQVTARPYAGETKIPLELEPIFSRKKGARSEVLATYDAEFRAGFDRRITDWAIDFMRRSAEQDKPFYVYLPYTQVHNPSIPDPEYAGKTRRGNWADLLTQIDDFTGQILDTLDELGIAENTIVVWASDNGADSEYRYPVGDPDPFGGQWAGFSGPWRGGLFTTLEGSNRTPCIVRWPGKVPAGRVSNELVHQVDWFTTLLLAAGAQVPADRQVDGMDLRELPARRRRRIGAGHGAVPAGQPAAVDQVAAVEAAPVPAGRDVLGLEPVQRAAHPQPGMGSPRRTPGRFPARLGRAPDGRGRGRVLEDTGGRAADQAGDTGPVHPAEPGELRPESHLQVGVITQYVTTLVQSHDELPDPGHGIEHQSG